MPLLRINATEDGLCMHGSQTPIADAIAAQTPASGPVVIMIHGYKYAPNDPLHCPHTKIFNRETGGWPKRLGFLSSQPDEGLCIAFGWYARGPLWQAHRRATELGRELAELIKCLRKTARGRSIHLIAHSLGSEIALSALAYLTAQSVERVLLLTGASYTSKALDMLATPAGLTTELFNVTSRENDLFDLAFEHLIPAPQLHDRAIGQGLDAPNAINLQLDCDTTLNAFTTLGLPVARPQHRVSHWSAYKRPGVMALYAQILRDSSIVTHTRLVPLLPVTPAPRWSRFTVPAQMLCLSVCRPLAPVVIKLRKRVTTLISARRKNSEPVY